MSVYFKIDLHLFWGAKIRQITTTDSVAKPSMGIIAFLILASGLEPQYCSNAYWLLCQSTESSKRRDIAHIQSQHGPQLVLIDKLIMHEIK